MHLGVDVCIEMECGLMRGELVCLVGLGRVVRRYMEMNSLLVWVRGGSYMVLSRGGLVWSRVLG